MAARAPKSGAQRTVPCILLILRVWVTKRGMHKGTVVCRDVWQKAILCLRDMKKQAERAISG